MVAAPVFKNINEKILALGQTIKKESNQQTDIKTVQNEIQENKSNYFPVKHQINPYVKKAENIFVSNTNKNIMPDLKGMTIKEALLIMNEMGIQCSISGSGVVTKQSIPAGTIIKSRKVCRITCSQLITEEASIY
jgi:cell division protein FtsI (penicillin-binding protein 3)